MLHAFRTSLVSGCPFGGESCMNLCMYLTCWGHRYRTDPIRSCISACTRHFSLHLQWCCQIPCLCLFPVKVHFWSQLRPILTVCRLYSPCVSQLHVVGRLTLQGPVVTICTAQWSLYVPDSGHYMYRTVVTIFTTSLTFNNSTFCPHSCIYVFCVNLRTNSDYFRIQH